MRLVINFHCFKFNYVVKKQNLHKQSHLFDHILVCTLTVQLICKNFLWRNTFLTLSERVVERVESYQSLAFLLIMTNQLTRIELFISHADSHN